jgi:hypothetical protein
VNRKTRSRRRSSIREHSRVEHQRRRRAKNIPGAGLCLIEVC